MDTIAEFPKPIIAAINGQASGFGFRVALCCDILIASEDAKMNLPEVSLGIIPGTGGSLRLARFVGKGKAMEMILTSEWIEAQEAYRVGLVSRVVPNSELLSTAKKIATRIASLPPIAVMMAKRSLNEALDIGNLKLAAQSDIYRQLLLYQTEDTREAHQAWREKRPPRFKGK
jgi:enoyl-CoA hydratase/carnithine racemase